MLKKSFFDFFSCRNNKAQKPAASLYPQHLVED